MLENPLILHKNAQKNNFPHGILFYLCSSVSNVGTQRKQFEKHQHIFYKCCPKSSKHKIVTKSSNIKHGRVTSFFVIHVSLSTVTNPFHNDSLRLFHMQTQVFDECHTPYERQIYNISYLKTFFIEVAGTRNNSPVITFIHDQNCWATDLENILFLPWDHTLDDSGANYWKIIPYGYDDYCAFTFECSRILLDNI